MNARMIDTMRLTKHAPMPPAEALQAQGYVVQRGTGRRGSWLRAWLNPTVPSRPRVTWLAHECDRSAVVMIEMSLANFWRKESGHALSTDAEITAALSATSRAASTLAHADLDLREMLVRRIDFYRDFRVGSDVMSYLAAARTATPTRLKLMQFDDSVYFQNATRAIVAYDKGAERRERKATDQEVEASRGLLRVEHRLMNTRACTYHARRAGCASRSARNLVSAAVSDFFVAEALRLLGLDQPVGGADERLAALVEAFGRDAAEMVGLLILRNSLGENFWQQLGWSPSTFARKRRLLQRGGFWLAAPNPRQLPALRLVGQRVESKAA